MYHRMFAIIMLVILLVFGTISSVEVTVPTQELTTNSSIANQPSNFALDEIPDHGESNASINLITNGEFERTGSYGTPEDFDTGGSGDSNVTEYYTDQVRSGSYSLMIDVTGLGYSSSTQRLVDYLPASTIYLSENLVFNSSLYFIDPATDENSEIFLTIEMRHDNGTYYYLYYQFSYGWNSYYNTTYQTSFLMNQAPDQWVDRSFDLKSDFEMSIGVSANIYVTRMDFFIESGNTKERTTQVIFDGLSLSNSSLYEYYPNGDFESGLSPSGWSTNDRSVGAVFSPTTDHIEGNQALNITMNAWGSGNRGSFSIYQSFTGYYDQYLLPSHPLSINWKLSRDIGTGSFNTYIAGYGYNYSHTVYFYLYLDRQSSIPANYTQPTSATLYQASPNIGSTGSWQYDEFDLYNLLKENDFGQVTLYDISLYSNMYSTYGNASVELLVDDFRITNYPTYDPGFEITEYETSLQPLAPWISSAADPSDITRSTSSRSGTYAGSISVKGTNYGYFYRNMNFYLDKTVYTNFYWKIDSMTLVPGLSSFITINLNNNYYVQYYLAGNSGYINSNSSNYLVFVLPEINSVGQWHQLFRNLKQEIVDAFGEADWYIKRVTLTAYSDVSGDINILLDDIHFIIDTTPPSITSLTVYGNPNYEDPTSISVEVSDILSSVVSVDVHYYNGSYWNSAALSFDTGIYIGNIPPLPYGTSVYYYIEVIDSGGNIGLLNNGGSNYTYFVDDFVAPNVYLLSPYNNSVIQDTVSFHYTSSDAGSDIDHVEFLLDTSVINGSLPYSDEFQIDTRTLPNRAHNITLIAIDLEGNQIIQYYKVFTDNDLEGPTISEPIITPKAPLPGEDVTVFTSVTDKTSVSSVTLHYKIGNNTWQSLMMNGSGDLYTAQIPAADTGETVQYYITALDGFDQESWRGNEPNPYQYSIPGAEDLNRFQQVLKDIEDLYNQNQFLAGVGASVFAMIALQLVIRRLRKRKK